MAITIESIVVVVVLLLGLLFQLLATGPNQGFSVKIRAEYPYSKFNENAVVNLKVERAYDNIQGPESIILDPFRNDIYVGIENGTVLKISPDGTRELFVQTPGRPLGGAVDNDGIGIYLCVPPFGLLYVRFEDRLIRLASSISDDRIPIRFIDDAAVASDGKVYFTDASRVAPVLNEDGRYDVLHASKVDSLAGSGTGRLLCFDPETGTTKTLLSRLMFANGVAISEDHSFVVVAESFAFHLRRYYINGPKAGTSDVFASALPGMPDGIDAAPGGGFNVAIVSEVTEIYNLISSSFILRYICAYVKPALIPKPRPFAAMIKLDDSGQIIKAFVDFKGLSSLPVTSVKEKGGHFFVGSLHNNFIGVFTEKKNNPLVDVW